MLLWRQIVLTCLDIRHSTSFYIYALVWTLSICTDCVRIALTMPSLYPYIYNIIKSIQCRIYIFEKRFLERIWLWPLSSGTPTTAHRFLLFVRMQAMWYIYLRKKAISLNGKYAVIWPFLVILDSTAKKNCKSIYRFISANRCFFRLHCFGKKKITFK